LVESPAVTDQPTGILAAALHCSNCRQSRVFDTTAEHVAAFLPVQVNPGTWSTRAAAISTAVK
jgi:hypothetical protein